MSLMSPPGKSEKTVRARWTAASAYENVADVPAKPKRLGAAANATTMA